MQHRRLNDTERGVSPVIGVILMVAITVILAAVIGTFVLGIAPDDDPAPTVQLSIVESDVPGEFDLRHNGGSELVTEDLSVIIDGSVNDSITIEGVTLSAGETTNVSNVPAGNGTDVSIRHDPSDSVLSSNTIDIE